MPISLRALLSALLLVVAGSALAQGGGLSGLFGGSDQPDLLPEAEAFPVTAERAGADRITLRWDVQSGYYLYRDKIAVRAAGRPDLVASVDLPGGEVTEDPYFGRQQVYREPVAATVRLAEPARGELTLMVDQQGCADVGVCYPPATHEVVVPAMAAGAAPAAGGGDGSGTGAGGFADSGTQRLAGTLAGGEPLLIIGAFLAAGLLLAFTACLYPMIPILSGLIAGDRHRGSAWRALGLSLVYVESTAVTYAGVGMLAGWTGAALQADMQSPWILGAFAGLFVVLALSMFGLFELQLPSSWQSRIAGLSSRQRGGTVLGVAIMGVLSTLIVGACSGPALAAALAFIARTGDLALGGLALFALANGMGLPLLLVGVGAGRWLPRAGGWMTGVRRVFGVAFLAVALWMLDRFLPAPLMLALWGVLLVGCGVYLGGLDRVTARAPGWLRLRKAGGLVLTLWGAVALVGAASGAGDLTRPLARLAAGPETAATPAVADAASRFRTIKTVADLDAALADARSAGRPVMLDVYADWCVYCIQLDERTFSDPRVQSVLADALLLRADVTANDAKDKALLKRLEVFLPPAVIFYDRDGEEVRAARVVGFLPPDPFIARARRALYGEAG